MSITTTIAATKNSFEYENNRTTEPETARLMTTTQKSDQHSSDNSWIKDTCSNTVYTIQFYSYGHNIRL